MEYSNKSMRYLILMPLIFLLSSAESKKSVERYNEYAFQCGAIYGILMKIYQEKPDEKKSKMYKMKFDLLSEKAEEEFRKIGKKKEDANIYMQQYVDDISLRAIKDIKIIPRFIKICKKVFPNV